MTALLLGVVVVVVLAEVLFVLMTATWSGRQDTEPQGRTTLAQGKLAALNETLYALHIELHALEALQAASLPAAQAQPRRAKRSTPLLPTQPPTPPPKLRSKTRSALVYTMDSIKDYVENSRQGGAAGEILVRRCLETALKDLGVDVIVIESDAEFNALSAADTAAFDMILLDPWTWAAKGWVPKPSLVGRSDKVYILDFFGSQSLRGSGLKVPPKRFLTAFGSPWNSFLGFYLEDPELEREKKGDSSLPLPPPRLQQGVVWGKDVKHFEGKVPMLQLLLTQGTHLASTATAPLFQHPNMKWLGHRTPEQWTALLRSSKFLLGLGDPLLGPSAIEAIAAGCVYINPIYTDPSQVKNGMNSQHAWAAEKLGAPYVCSYLQSSAEELQRCVATALKADLSPRVPLEFSKDAHRERVRQIFDF